MFLIMSYAIGVHHIFLTMSHNDLAVAVCATGEEEVLHREPFRVAKLDTFVTKLKSQRDHLRHLVSLDTFVTKLKSQRDHL